MPERRSLHGSLALPLLGGLELELARDRAFLELETLGSARVEIHARHWRRLRPELEAEDRTGEVFACWGVLDVQLAPSSAAAPLARWLAGRIATRTRPSANEPDEEPQRIHRDARAS